MASLPPKRSKARGDSPQPLSRSEIMSRIRSRNTKPELTVRSAVHSQGYRYRVDVRSLPGRPDLANRKQGWAIFVHGCFWHSHEGCRLASKPKSNRGYWDEKLIRNRERDEQKVAELLNLGFRVHVIWECDVRARRFAEELLAFLADEPRP